MRVMRDPKGGYGAGALGVAGALLLVFAGPPASAAGDPFAAMDAHRSALEVQAPGFRLQKLDGKALALEDLKGKVVLLYFWRTW